MKDPADYDISDPLFRPLTLAEAAAVTSRSQKTVRRWVREGRLTAFEMGNRREIVLVERDVVEVEKAARDAFAAGRPRKISPDAASGEATT